ncbi:MAG: hypothetical protein ACREAX_05460 [Candidatus Nitrosotenuis sp.]
MTSIELLWFEDVNPFNESVFEFPVVGKLSMRQMLILGLGVMLSWSLYQSTASYMSLIPMLVAAYISLKKHKVRTVESQLFAILLFYVRLKAKNGTKKPTSRIPQMHKIKKTVSKLRVAEPFRPKLELSRKEINTREIHTDPLRPIRLKIHLQKTDGKVIANTETKIVFDGKVVSSLSTDSNGEVEAIIIPQTTGEKKLAIYAKGVELPVYQEIISVKYR